MLSSRYKNLKFNHIPGAQRKKKAKTYVYILFDMFQFYYKSTY